ncbi:uncharacterized protein VDAG_04791 [Verticillium dahliae VdLs.17]|uniref:Rhodopsin domain-containing protein n=1 Tax=Verticillium dahliae (strain VdLs.17 / ATCC MYA-4575 / FGSC 10137) TaxID=498257 RepID=G2X454_VERDV|nr:uncharacterized protein VDAG_04791 [Verticillium dahliae VdLs.17]EGY23353.1 hypothetical protein VDAG_04791 [Verticillium dahliae VdLs.17]
MNDDGSLSHDSLGPRALAIVTPFFVLAILIFSLFEVVIYSLFAITVASGFGRHSYDDIRRVSTTEIRPDHDVARIHLFLQCRPINAHWEEVPGARCFSAEQIWICGYVIVAAAMFGDLTLAVMPMFLIWKLSRSIVERCLLTFLMALGLVATTAVVMRVVIMHTFDYTSPENFFRAATQVPN